MNTYFLPVTQWAAVSTEFSLTKTPPQMCANCLPVWWTWRLTDHGHAPIGAFCPPTIREPKMLSKSGRCPHAAKQNRVGYILQAEKNRAFGTLAALWESGPCLGFESTVLWNF